MVKFLITGQMRSGTTLLCNFLNSQPNITAWADIFHSVAGKIPHPKGWHSSKINYNQNLPVTQRLYLLYTMSFGIDVLKKSNNVNYDMLFNPSQFNTVDELYNILLDSISNENDHAVGHKVTECELNIPSILSQTDIKVIYIYRDVRDVVPSGNKKFNRNIKSSCLQWNKAIDIVSDINHTNFLMVKFEDLISKDDDVKQKLNYMLNTTISYQLNELYAYNNVFTANSSFNDIDSIFDENAIFRWENNSDKKLLNYINTLCHDRIVRAGYKPLEE